MLRRIFNKPFTNRYYQAINGMIIPLIGRQLHICHIVEYPKCGASWLRRMLETYLDVQPYHSDRYISKQTAVQLHRLSSPLICNPIVLFRDPRDVFVSFYFYERNRLNDGVRLAIGDYFRFDDNKNISDNFQKYLEIKLTKQTDPYFTYKQFYESWSKINNKCLVTYEGFHADTSAELRKVLNYLRIEIDDDRIRYAINHNTFKMVTKRKYNEERQPGQEDANKFQRKGVVGDWVNYFNEESAELIQHHMGDMMRDLGYLP